VRGDPSDPAAPVSGAAMRAWGAVRPSAGEPAPRRDGSAWEDAVRWYRSQPGNGAAVRDNYFDLPVRRAAERYAAGAECAAVLDLLGPGDGRWILDLGAGNGVTSYALARAGWRVTALEPDPSREVGSAAIHALARETGLPIRVVRQRGEALPFREGTFDAVHGRQVLHHAADLDRMLAEAARVLAPGGACLFTREHVVDGPAQLARFLASHPLQRRYGGEHAHPRARYEAAIRAAGLDLARVWGPLESPLNFHPGTEAQRRAAVFRSAARSLLGLGALLAWSAAYRRAHLRRLRAGGGAPGRLYSFLAVKPCAC
jgi:SAM-dependent methyltransferase